MARDVLRGRKAAVFAHHVPRLAGVRGTFIPDAEPSERDVELAQRLLVAYSAAMSDEAARPARAKSDVWSSIAARQRTFFETLGTGDRHRLAAYLCNMSRHDATLGTVQGADEYRRLRRSGRYRRYIASMAKDKLVSLAEAVGGLPCENPEQGRLATNFQLDVPDLVACIEEQLGINITPPPIDSGLFKIGSNGIFFGERDCNAIYTAWLMKSLMERREREVAEIGGGVGRVAYWSRRLGVERYTLFDLPHINVLQGWYLAKSSCNVRLYGESIGESGAGVVAVLPYFMCEQTSPGQFDLILNQDSFPEIDTDIVRGYLRWMRASTQWFLSINHESRPNGLRGARQNSVADLIREVGGYERRSRQMYWLRRGYVAELYRVVDPAHHESQC